MFRSAARRCLRSIPAPYDSPISATRSSSLALVNLQAATSRSNSARQISTSHVQFEPSPSLARDPDLLPPRPKVLPQADSTNVAKPTLGCAGDVDLANKAAFTAAWRKLEARLGPQGIMARSPTSVLQHGCCNISIACQHTLRTYR